LRFRKKTKRTPKGPIEAVIELLSEELRDLISGLPEHLQESVPEQLKGRPGERRQHGPERKQQRTWTGYEGVFGAAAWRARSWPFDAERWLGAVD
jgi:hypothetical protein